MKSASPGDPQAPDRDRRRRARPGGRQPTSTPGTRARCAAYGLPIAPAADDGDAGHDAYSASIRAMSAQTVGSQPPTPVGHHLPRRHGPAARRERRAPAAPPAPPAHATARPVRQPEAGAEVAAAAVEQGRRARRPPARQPMPAGRRSIRSCCTGSPPRSTTATATRTPRRVAASMAASQSPPGPVELGLAAAGGRGAMPRLSAGSTARSPKRWPPSAAGRPRAVRCTGRAEGVGDQQVLGVGKPAVGAHHARVDALAGRTGSRSRRRPRSP